MVGRGMGAWAGVLVLALGVGCAGARPWDGLNGSGARVAWGVPETCKVLDCPKYDVIRSNEGYQVRKYDAGASYAVARMERSSGFEAATTAGFKELFLYISGVNWGARRMAMTAPVRTRVMPKGAKAGGVLSGHASEAGTVYEVGFMVPFEEQARSGGPPSPLVWAEPNTRVSLEEPSWCAGVRIFGGFATDAGVVRESAILADDLRADDFPVHDEASFTVLQYNSPSEKVDRTNEILFVLPRSACEASAPPSSSDFL